MAASTVFDRRNSSEERVVGAIACRTIQFGHAVNKQKFRMRVPAIRAARLGEPSHAVRRRKSASRELLGSRR